MKMTVEEILQACGGTLLCGDPATEVTSVETDSREILPGGLFIPLKGEHNDGHDFIEKAFQNGAAAVLSQRDTEKADSRPWIQVTDTQEALHQIASTYRNRFSLPLIGITGSVGKTTTKEMIALALSAGKNVMKTAGNLNSQVGLPSTMFRLEPEHTAAVIEMGMSAFGEMERLSRIARPHYAVITNIGIAHIENLKSQENILSEKLRIADDFDGDSVLFVNGDDPMLASMGQTLPGRRVVYGTSSQADYRAENIQTEGRSTSYTLYTPTESRTITLPILGIHNVLNSLAAIAVAESLGLKLDSVLEKLKEYVPPAMRQEIHEVNGLTIIDDSYNASPDSIKSGLDVLCGLEAPGRHIAALADMLELGEFSDQAHFDVGVHAAKAGVDLLLSVGSQAGQTAKGAHSVRPGLQVVICSTNHEAVEYLKKQIKKGDCIMVKGSRSMKTDEIVKELLQK